ncbi:MAG: octaprenyl diphosphate synthase [Gammaproteobacteria bacterium]|nr:octaprenyl diphosphate synthase [Gammaproteobacteria bacterium]
MSDSSIQAVLDLISEDMSAVNDLILKRLHSEVVLVNQLGHYIISSGGKRLRPALVLLSAGACNYQGTHHHQAAAIVEFIHTATLLHDDVVDASELRRGRETANALFGNEASVLVGDFLYSRAFQMMVEIGQMRVMDILAEATNVIAEGEVLQLLNCHDPDTTEARYMEVIHSKTAKLFEAASQLGAILSGQSEEIESALAAYGMHLGTSFQLIDDVLDYSASSEEMGKNVGDDLAEGKPTLPLIYAMRNGTEEQAAVVRKAIEDGGHDLIEPVTEAIQATGAIAYTEQVARDEANRAIACLESLPDSPYKEAMIVLAEFSVNRTY